MLKTQLAAGLILAFCAVVFAQVKWKPQNPSGKETHA